MSLKLLPAACELLAVPDVPNFWLLSLVSFQNLEKPQFLFELIEFVLILFISTVKCLCGNKLVWCSHGSNSEQHKHP